MDYRARVLVSGRVQGVGYRAWTRRAALGLGLRGWVRNLDDGRVEAVLQGPKERVDEMLVACKRGPPPAFVSELKVEWEPAGDEVEFLVRR